jgi:hypothetical protein
VCAEWSGPGGEDPYDDAMSGEQGYGSRPAGMRPAGMRPAGMRPAGMRPAGMRPAGMRPAGMRPAGMRPAGMRPAGMRPYDDTGGLLDAEEWSADIAELFCEASAVVRLGARLLFGVDDLPVPARRPDARYLPPPEKLGDQHHVAAAAAHPLAAVAGDAEVTLGRRRHNLRPRRYELVAQVKVRNWLIRAIAAYPEAAMALKQDLARALASAADAAFLHGRVGGEGPAGIARRGGMARGGRQLLVVARAMVKQLRDNDRVRFAKPGWVIDLPTLDELTTNTDALRRTLDTTRLLVLDDTDGGFLLGYPFVATTAAREETAGGPRRRMYFSADWSEAWIGIDQDLVTVDFSTETAFTTDETIIRAVMHHDFVVRTPSMFVFTVTF